MCSRPLSNSNPIFSSFLVHFEWFKTIGCILEAMMQRSTNLSSKFYLFFINHNRTLNPLTSNTLSSPFLYQIEQFLSCWKQHPKGYKFSLTFRSRGTMCENSTSFEFLNVCSLTYLPYQANVNSNQAKSNDALNPKCMLCAL
jgi:hypothetical protein